MQTAHSQDLTVSRLRWQCRRGMRELDELLSGWLDLRFASSGPAERRAFCRLLALADEDLIDYLLGGRPVTDPDLADVVREIRLRPAHR